MNLLKFVGKRVIISIPVLFLMTVFIFFLSNMIPGSPADALISPDMPESERERIVQSLGLDKPIYVQYGLWLGRFVRGNLGISYRTGTPVTAVLSDRLGPTLILTGTAIVLMVIFGLTLGILAAIKPYSAWDYISSGIAFLGSGMPNFFMALVAIYLFAVHLRLLPTGGMYTTGSNRSLAELLRHLILPAMVLAVTMMGSLIRQTRSAMLEVSGEDYVRMAMAKGMRKGNVIFHQILRNALIPVSTQIGLQITHLIGGAVVTEQIFGWPGLGSLLVSSIAFRDYPTIMGITIYVTIIVMILNIIMDIIYGFLDPRVRI
jgi:peptide/nickel transport system permease protein